MTLYADASAASKLFVAERESAAVRDCFLQAARDGETVMSSVLLETELRRTAQRSGHSQTDVTAVLDVFVLAEADRQLFHEAGVLPGSSLRALDALHVATALRAGADTFVSYDARQCAAAREVGLHVVSPGVSS